LVKLDLGNLESVIQDIFDENQALKEKLKQLETTVITKLNDDELFEKVNRHIVEVESKSSQHTISIGNIQAKVIDIEKQFLKMNENTMNTLLNSDKDTKASLRREIKIINTKLFEAEKRLPEVAKQLVAPVEKRLLLAYSCINDLEHQLDDVEERVNDIEVANGGSKRIDIEKLEPEEDIDVTVSPTIPDGSQANNGEFEAGENLELLSNNSMMSRGSKHPRRNNRKIKSYIMDKQFLSVKMNLDGTQNMSDDFLNGIDERLRELEDKMSGNYKPPRSFNENDPEAVVVSYNEFEDRKVKGELFEDEDKRERIDAAKFDFDEVRYLIIPQFTYQTLIL